MSAFLPYGKQHITEEDVQAVAAALREPLITQGPLVEEFERAFADTVGARHAVAFATGTAALHGAAVAAGVGPGDEIVTTPISFVASANCALFAGGRPRFADIDHETWNLDLAAADLSGAKAVVPVSLTGLPVDLEPVQAARRDGLVVIEDACHALGGERAGRPIGGDGMADMYAFSLHPVKAITTGEGGVIATDSDEYAAHLREFRTHGIRRGDGTDPWHYDVVELGWNYRITDFACALGRSQLTRLGDFIDGRNRVAAAYRERLQDVDGVTLPAEPASGDRHAYHLFVVRFGGRDVRRRAALHLREQGIGTQLHYIPIYRHTLYRDRGYNDELPHAEAYYEQALSLPMFPSMTDADVDRVVEALREVLAEVPA